METQTQAKTIEVTVKPNHLKGNTWNHSVVRGSEGRRCPLEEALVEMGYPNAFVGGTYFYLDFNNASATRYDLDMKRWDRDVVERYVEEANQGSEKEITLIGTKTYESD